jgi:type I restriction enzyme S subunit
MNAELLLAHFNRISDAPDAIPRLRRFILDLAVRGKLVEPDPADEPASELLNKIRVEKVGLVKQGHIQQRGQFATTATDQSLGVTPQGWVLTTLGEIAHKITDGAHKTPTYVDRGVPFISVKDFSGGKLDFSHTRLISPEEHTILYKRCDPRRGDILIGRIGTLGKAVLVDTDREFSLFVSVGLIRFSQVFIAPVFFRLLLNSPLLENEYNRIKVGGGTHTNKLNLGDLHTIIFPLPPLAEQHRIVAKVDELMALCDRLEKARAAREKQRDCLTATFLHNLNNGANAEMVREHARSYFKHLSRLTIRPDEIPALRQTILSLAFRGQLAPQDPKDESAFELVRRILAMKALLAKKGKIRSPAPLASVPENVVPFRLPTGWLWVRFGELIEDADAGWSPTSENFPRSGDNWGVLKVSAVSWDRFLPEENKQLLPGVAPREAAQVHAGDFLISRANTSELVAKCVIVEQEPQNLILSDKIVRLRISKGCNKRFLSLVNNHATHARAYYAEEASGTSFSMKNVSRAVIYGLTIPLPPLAEQDRIVTKVNELMAVCDRLVTQLTTAQDQSQRLLEAVLHQALAHVPQPEELVNVSH